VPRQPFPKFRQRPGHDLHDARSRHAQDQGNFIVSALSDLA
jgi:hypothetical protein